MHVAYNYTAAEKRLIYLDKFFIGKLILRSDDRSLNKSGRF